MNIRNCLLSADQLYRIANLLPVGILVLGLDHKVIFCNKVFFRILEVRSDDHELISENIHFQKLVDEISQCKGESKQPFLFYVSPNVSYAISTSVSEQEIIIIAEKMNMKEEVETGSVQAILEGQENERRRIGREIHDGIGPLLSYVKFSFDNIAEEVDKKGVSQSDLLKSISQTIDVVSEDLRSLSHRLVPRTLDEFGLHSAFYTLISKLNESKKVPIEFYTNIKSELRFDNDIELTIYRCAQELLNNAMKYARASHILVQIILHSESIVLMVEDDGVGFDKINLPENHRGIGLTNVETRVKLLEGEYNLDSIKGRGTAVSIEIPLKRK
jgi:signal transduction histidine kinase